MHFTLGDVTSLGPDHVLDRVFQGDDMIMPGSVDLLHQSGQRGALARADRSGDQDETVLVLGEELELLWEAELVHRANPAADDTEGEIVPEALPDHAGAESTKTVGVGKIHVAALGHDLFLGLGQETHGQPLGIRGGQYGCLLPDRLELAETPPDRLGVHAQVNIRCVRFLADRQVLVNVIEGANFIVPHDFNVRGRRVCWGGHLRNNAYTGPRKKQKKTIFKFRLVARYFAYLWINSPANLPAYWVRTGRR